MPPFVDRGFLIARGSIVCRLPGSAATPPGRSKIKLELDQRLARSHHVASIAVDEASRLPGQRIRAPQGLGAGHGFEDHSQPAPMYLQGFACSFSRVSGPLQWSARYVVDLIEVPQSLSIALQVVFQFVRSFSFHRCSASSLTPQTWRQENAKCRRITSANPNSPFEIAKGRSCPIT